LSAERSIVVDFTVRARLEGPDRLFAYLVPVFLIPVDQTRIPAPPSAASEGSIP